MTLPDRYRADVEALWDYHDMHHNIRPSDIGIGLGSHDLGVATFTAELYHQGVLTDGSSKQASPADSSEPRRAAPGDPGTALVRTATRWTCPAR